MIPIILKTALPAALNQIRQGSTFLSVRHYKNNFDEVSDFGIVFHANYITAVKKAMGIWYSFQANSALELAVRADLLASYRETLDGFNSRARSAFAYRPISDGQTLVKSVKWHDNGKAVHLWGFLVHKVILKKGEYPFSEHDDFTMTRQRLMRLTQLGRFRQFKIVEGRFQAIHVDHLTLTQKDLVP